MPLKIASNIFKFYRSLCSIIEFVGFHLLMASVRAASRHSIVIFSHSLAVAMSLDKFPWQKHNKRIKSSSTIAQRFYLKSSSIVVIKNNIFSAPNLEQLQGDFGIIAQVFCWWNSSLPEAVHDVYPLAPLRLFLDNNENIFEEKSTWMIRGNPCMHIKSSRKNF